MWFCLKCIVLDKKLPVPTNSVPNNEIIKIAAKNREKCLLPFIKHVLGVVYMLKIVPSVIIQMITQNYSNYILKLYMRRIDQIKI